MQHFYTMLEDTVSCDIDTQSIGREYSVWIDATTSYSKQCSLVYCNPDYLQVNLSNVDGADVQCLHHRSGVLCGGCRKNYSLATGSSNCLADCSNRYLSLLAVFALAGVLLVLAIKYITQPDGNSGTHQWSRFVCSRQTKECFYRLMSLELEYFLQ